MIKDKYCNKIGLSEAGEHSNIGTIGVAIGFTIMMILDVDLG